MAKKTKLTTVCQDCLNSIPDKLINKYPVAETTSGPAHNIMLCKNCLVKREK